ncbi:hypothetical protein [Sphingomonas sp.]|uniref:hypothetical protein n=1 Tax=Sphingomonas sp. TaxID=28214 RepID=UPI003B008E56
MIALILLAMADANLRAPQTATLACGAGTFIAESRRWAGDQAPLAPATQSLSVTVAKTRRSVPLEPTRIVDVEERQVRNRFLANWGCVKGVTGASYVVLGYACAVDPGYANDCGGEQEWFRYLNDRGRVMDMGVPHNGPVRTRLQRRLGIARALRTGRRFTAVVS